MPRTRPALPLPVQLPWLPQHDPCRSCPQPPPGPAMFDAALSMAAQTPGAGRRHHRNDSLAVRRGACRRNSAPAGQKSPHGITITECWQTSKEHEILLQGKQTHMRTAEDNAASTQRLNDGVSTVGSLRGAWRTIRSCIQSFCAARLGQTEP
jgi:hypothetical protein